ncbi:MAG: isoaspartyl peptidase/L-asparaginase, partial [Chitinophagales bacterium]|nr:isoaspartyl peptidase/L-asparaginase [Chitinophagales bacterium]
MKKFCLAVHGGAGALLPSDFTPEEEERYKIELKQALDHGYNILKENGSALDAVEACVKYLEDCPLFNAGRGSVYNFDGKHEMDASIMCGATLKAGAVALVRRVKNPVALARLVMERSDYVFLCGEGAEQFAEFYNIEMADETYFDTPLRLAQWMKLKGTDIAQLDHTSISKSDVHTDNQKENSKFGTVGAVALDLQVRVSAPPGYRLMSLPGQVRVEYGPMRLDRKVSLSESEST